MAPRASRATTRTSCAEPLTGIDVSKPARGADPGHSESRRRAADRGSAPVGRILVAIPESSLNPTPEDVEAPSLGAGQDRETAGLGRPRDYGVRSMMPFMPAS